MLIKDFVHTPIIKDFGAVSEIFKNYRPISYTPLLAKRIEKAALYQVNAFLVEKKFAYFYTIGVQNVSLM